MKKLIILSIWALSNVLLSQSNVLTIQDFNFLNNSNWQGSLMYVNYSDNKEVFIPTSLTISIKNNTVNLLTTYPNEPKANSKSVIKLRKKGTYFGNEKVDNIERRQDGSLLVKTSYNGRDNGQKAIFYKFYELGVSSVIITKEVQLIGTHQTFIRNKTTLKKIKL